MKSLRFKDGVLVADYTVTDQRCLARAAGILAEAACCDPDLGAIAEAVLHQSTVTTVVRNGKREAGDTVDAGKAECAGGSQAADNS